VERRHIAEKDEDDSDILAKSARGCLEKYGYYRMTFRELL